VTLTLISIGLADERDLRQRALDEARTCNSLYAELYTMILDTTPRRLSELIGKPVTELPRGKLEEEAAALVEEAKDSKVGILVGGDALAATTHISLILEAAKAGVETRVIHGSSILAAVAETGLSPYKLGRSVTLPLPEKAPPDTVLRTLAENREHGLHTLVLLDLDTRNRRAHTIPKAVRLLLDADRTEIYGDETLTVGIARLGWENQEIKAGTATELMAHDFGDPPHALIVPGNLHFVETEALATIAGSPPEALDSHSPVGDTDRLIEKYSRGCLRAIEELRETDLPKSIGSDEVKSLIEHAARYVDDAEYYARERKATALASVSYAEGILDALRLLGLVEFEW